MPPTSHQNGINASEERLNAIIHAAMSRAFTERDKLVQSYQRAVRDAESLFERLSAAERRLISVERNAANVEASSLQSSKI